MTDTDHRVRRALEGEQDGLHSRVLPLDDIEILSRAKGGDGRTVVAYAAAFGRRAEISDQDGHYTEENDPRSFDKSVAERGLRFGVFYHHGRTLHGTPSERGSVPLGRPVLVKPDGPGLLTHTAYNRTALADEVLESIRNGDPMGMSFTGAYLQSDPPRAPYHSRSDGTLQHVVRKEIALIEYGPTPMPAYQDAAILGVRAAQQREAERERESVTLNGHTGDGAEPAGAQQEPAPAPDGAEGRESSRAAMARHEPIDGTHSHPHPAYGSQGGDASHTHEHAHAGDASHAHTHDTGSEGGDDGMTGRAASMGEVLLLGDGWVQDPDGTVRFDPDGDGDDDSTPGGDTDHDFWDADGNPLQEIPPRPAGRSGGQDAPEVPRAAGTGLSPHAHPAAGAPARDGSSRSATATFALCRHFRMTAEQAEALSGQERALLLLSIAAVHDRAATVDRSAWDAAKAWAAGAASDDPASFYNAICAGKKAGDPATQDAHALPHHYAPGDPPNADGVRNSLSRLPQTDGLTNAAAAKAHLQAHMNVISPGTSSGDSGT